MTDTRGSATVDFTALLLDILGHGDGEYTALGYEDADGVFHTAVVTPADAPAILNQIPATANIYFGVNAVKGPARRNAGRGREADVTRLTALVCDIDIKPGGCPSLDVAQAIIANLSIILGTRPSVIVESGHGLHAYWPISDGHITGGDIRAARALLKRWGRLVTVVAENLGAGADNVFDLPRMMRVPGTSNVKAAGNGAGPVPVIAHTDTGGPLTMAEVDERLTEVGIPAEPDDLADHTEPLSAPDGWRFAGQTCSYVAAIIAALPADGPPENPKPGKGRGRHQWAASQAVKLTCAQRLGCISETDWHTATNLLKQRLAELRAATNQTVPRAEIPGLFTLGRQRTTCKTDEQCRAELGDHSHGDSTDSSPPPTVEPITLEQAHIIFRRRFGQHYDTDALDITLAAAAVERLDGDPVWVLAISGSGAAKTETVQPLTGIGATITSAITSAGALLSATSAKERTAGATGGLLKKIGDRGILVIKDFTTILSMDRNARAEVLAALREIFDGYWERNVGTDGGRSLSWRGRLIIIAACTTAWDKAHAVISVMGNRFVLVRIDSEDEEGREESGIQSILNLGSETEMRKELADAVAGVIAGMNTKPPELDNAESLVLVRVANLATKARTAVEVDYRGDVEDAHAPEAPTRFAKQLAQIVRGATAIGVNRQQAMKLAIRCAGDSLPPLRLAILRDLGANPSAICTAVEVAKRIDKPRTTVDRQLQALHALGVATVKPGSSPWDYSLKARIDPSVLDPEALPEMLVKAHKDTEKREERTSTEEHPPTHISGSADDTASDQQDSKTPVDTLKADAESSTSATSDLFGTQRTPDGPSGGNGAPPRCKCGNKLLHPAAIWSGQCRPCRGYDL